jgi:uncharacterized cupin superfamily protein
MSGGHTVVDASTVEPAMGAFRKMRVALGVKAFGINQIEMPGGFAGPEHDERATGHEEVYVVLSGAGALAVDASTSSCTPAASCGWRPRRPAR